VQGLLAAEREDEVKELVAKLHQERMDGIWKGDMLHHLIRQHADIRPDDVVLNNDVNGKIACTSVCSVIFQQLMLQCVSMVFVTAVLFVCLCICLSYSFTVSKRLNLSSNFVHNVVVLSF